MHFIDNCINRLKLGHCAILCAVYSMAGFQPWTKDAPQTIKRNKNRTTTMKAHTTSFYMMNIIKLYTKQLRHQWDEFLLIDCIFFTPHIFMNGDTKYYNTFVVNKFLGKFLLFWIAHNFLEDKVSSWNGSKRHHDIDDGDKEDFRGNGREKRCWIVSFFEDCH